MAADPLSRVFSALSNNALAFGSLASNASMLNSRLMSAIGNNASAFSRLSSSAQLAGAARAMQAFEAQSLTAAAATAGKLNASAAQQIMANPQAFSAMMANPRAFEALAARPASAWEKTLNSAGVPAGRVFDAAKVRYAWESGWVDAFAGRVVIPDDNNFNNWNEDDLFSGIYASSPSIIPKQETQVYFLARNVGEGSPAVIGPGLPANLTGVDRRRHQAGIVE